MDQSNDSMAEPVVESKIKIVLLEDQIVLRKAIRRILETQKIYNVEEFGNSKDAIVFLRENHVDFIISDIFLPRGSGWDVLYYIRNRSIANDIPILFVSGQADKEDVVLSFQQGVDGYVLKPFETSDLIEKIKSIWAEYRQPSKKIQLLRKAEKLFLSRDIDNAIKLYDEVCSFDQDSAKAMVGLANCMIEKGNTSEAKVILEAAIGLNQFFWPAFTSLADLYLLEKNDEKAVEFILAELELHSKQPQRRIHLAKILFRLDRQAEGFEQARLALLANMKNEETLLFFAESYLNFGNLEKSLHYFLKTRRALPDSVLALEGIIKVCRVSNNLKKALHFLADFIAIHPGRKDLHWYRSKLLVELNLYDKALQDNDVVLRLDPDFFPANQLRTTILLQQGNFSIALQHQLLVVSKWNSAETQSLLALIYYKKEEFDLAVSTYLKVLKLKPNDSRVLFNLGLSYEGLGKDDQANSCYRNILNLSKDNSVEHKEAQKRLQRGQKIVSSNPVM